LLYEISQEKSMLGASRHLLYIGRKNEQAQFNQSSPDRSLWDQLPPAPCLQSGQESLPSMPE